MWITHTHTFLFSFTFIVALFALDPFVIQKNRPFDKQVLPPSLRFFLVQNVQCEKKRSHRIHFELHVYGKAVPKSWLKQNTQ